LSAPSTGLNFGGQRGRSNLVQVDGADNTDNSVNASRSTVSQEAVQEFQVVSNSFAPEFGRSSGGVVNVVTKAGTNDLHGNVFGFLRHKSFQARNAFAPITDPPFTRAQYGGTIGGAFKKDRTFFFGSFEQRQRHESGFFTSNVAQGLTSSVIIPITGCIGSGQVKIIALNGSAEDEKSATNEEKSKEEGPPQKAVGLKLHPKVFEMIRGLGPDGEYPLVTEINLDAVDRDTDRFKMADVKQEGMWFGVVNEDGRGFWRYQMLKQTGDRYTAEYQYNGGGTLTESSIIEFAVEKRPIKKDGKPLSIRVLHVL